MVEMTERIGAMPWKRDENDQIVELGGNPVIVYPDGKEAPFDGDATITAINKANGEATERRHQLKDLNTALAPLKDAGVEFSPDKILEFVSGAVKNSEIVQNFDDKDFVAANKVKEITDKAIANVEQSYKKKINDQEILFTNKEADYLKKYDQMDKMGRKLLIESEFKSSEFLKKQIPNVPWDFFYNTYEKNFSVEHDNNGKANVKAQREDGTDVISLSKPGQFADPQEAIEILINEHPRRDSFMSGFQNGGAGSSQSQGGSTKFLKTVKADDRAAMSNPDIIKGIASGDIVVE